jgi:hypothetical protein
LTIDEIDIFSGVLMARSIPVFVCRFKVMEVTPLAFVAGCYEKLIAADYEKAYALFLVSQSCHEL